MPATQPAPVANRLLAAMPRSDRGHLLAGTKDNSRGITVKYECNVCGYVYDPEVGDPDNGI